MGGAILPFNGLVSGCHHVKNYYSERLTILICGLGSIVFVGALYLLVPKRVRQLNRDDPIQIQWRSLSTFLVCLGACFVYPYFFCQDEIVDFKDDNAFSMLRILLRPTNSVLGVLLHTIVLYTGPIVVRLTYLYKSTKQQRINDGTSYLTQVYTKIIKPTFTSFVRGPFVSSQEERWKNIRNFIVAPSTEEIFFRGCMVPCLLSSGMSILKVTWVSPLFFGVAHVHHAIIRLSKGERLFTVLLITIFQFAYTTLFGSYASYAFIRTGSVVSVIISHSFCNWMGLPDLSFVKRRHYLYEYRIPLLLSYLAGICGFVLFFSNSYLLPLPAILPKLII